MCRQVIVLFLALSSSHCLLTTSHRPPKAGTMQEADCIADISGFTCADGINCVARHFKCDGFADCADGSDESSCFQLFQCRNLRFILPSYRCDGEDDCEDGSDESFCAGIGKPLPVPAVVCAKDQFNCNGEQCIPNHQRCNMERNCRNGHDEKNCPCNGPDKFQCKNGRCIEGWRKCDRSNDCGDRSDEMGCATYACKVNEHKCRDGTCALWNVACKDGSGRR
ncbi:hypothetical protein RvY_12626-1 [Ramazzottius varieornatus]|uniref:Uncharacterized protein n=1 Tax=Ramazzottius varieornatus TaxID=947166 RepID=A0A1D1VQL0_RAMVA|nr:hypothetical protein RvY_12626-1 [Ramazzottius varieornatus]